MGVRDLLKNILLSAQVSEARQYLNVNAQSVAKRVDKVAGPYRDVATKSVLNARTVVDDTIKQVRSADSMRGLISVLIGIIMSILQFIMHTIKQIRGYVFEMYHEKYTQARSRVVDVVDNIKTRAVDLPNTPVAKKVESVSKRFLGDTRHEQAVEFIKGEVIPRVYRGYEIVASASPSGSIQTDATTEIGSVSPSSRSGGVASIQHRPKKVIPLKKTTGPVIASPHTTGTATIE